MPCVDSSWSIGLLSDLPTGLLIMDDITFLELDGHLVTILRMTVTPPLQMFDRGKTIRLLKITGTMGEDKVMSEINRVA